MRGALQKYSGQMWKGVLMMAELSYVRSGDYLIPDMRLTVDGPKELGRYGRMRRAYLEENDPILLNDLILTEKLFPHLWEIQETAERRMGQLMAELLMKDPAPDKAKDQMGWVRHMNSLRAQAEEIVTAELINS
jgi:hypothetical protein